MRRPGLKYENCRLVVRQDKANLRSPFAARKKCLSAHCFLHIAIALLRHSARCAWCRSRQFRLSFQCESAVPFARCVVGDSAILHDTARNSSHCLRWRLIDSLRCDIRRADSCDMAGDDSDDFRIRPGRSSQLVERALESAPAVLRERRSSRPSGRRAAIRAGSEVQPGRRSGRFNARGRGAKVVASFPRMAADGGATPPAGFARGASSSRRGW